MCSKEACVFICLFNKMCILSHASSKTLYISGIPAMELISLWNQKRLTIHHLVLWVLPCTVQSSEHCVWLTPFPLPFSLTVSHHRCAEAPTMCVSELGQVYFPGYGESDGLTVNAHPLEGWTSPLWLHLSTCHASLQKNKQWSTLHFL